MRLVIGLVTSAALLTPIFAFNAADARWKEEYSSASPEEQAWYRRQQTTTETRRRLGTNWYQYCCDHSDTVHAKFSKSEGQWMYQEEGSSEWRSIPQDAVQPDIDTPRGKPILFVDATHHNYGPTCFFPGGTGT